MAVLGRSWTDHTYRGWQMARYRSTENDTIVSTEAYEALDRGEL